MNVQRDQLPARPQRMHDQSGTAWREAIPLRRCCGIRQQLSRSVLWQQQVCQWWSLLSRHLSWQQTGARGSKPCLQCQPSRKQLKVHDSPRSPGTSVLGLSVLGVHQWQSCVTSCYSCIPRASKRAPLEARGYHSRQTIDSSELAFLMLSPEAVYF